MGRYYFHLKRVDQRILWDEEGSELPDLEAARAEALQAARALVADAILMGCDVETQAILVMDEQGQELNHIPLRMVMPKSLLSRRLN